MSQKTTTAPAPSTSTDSRPTAASLDRLIAVLPEVADEAMRETMPGYYTAERAAKFAKAMAAELRARQAELTAVQS